MIDAVSSAGSFLDGGGSKPMQRAAIDLLSLEHARAETTAIHETFSKKRTLMLEGLARLGVAIDVPPEGTFYAWGSVADLPEGLDDGLSFFRAALDEKVIVVPGQFFDVNPGKRRSGRTSRFARHIRFSFGPAESVLTRALGRLQKLVDQRRAATG